MRLRSIVTTLAVGAALFATPALAQTTGGLSGQIIDANTQSPVADAVVIATSPQLQGEQTAVSDSTGNFEITLLPAGTYTLTVQREGYSAFSQPGLTVRLDRTIRIKLSLVPDTMQASAVEIVAQKPTIATTSTQTGGTVSREQMALVPYGRGARNFEAVATSIPGVVGDAYGVQMNGATSPETNYIIDGVQVNDPAVGTQGTTLIQDFVQEVDIKTGGYQAEYGRASGGIVNVVTKSGGNEFHGSVFVNWSPFEAERKIPGTAGQAVVMRTSQKYNLDFGAELGGPILKDKLWFYAGFAPQIQSLNRDRIIQKQLDDGTGRARLDNVGNPLTEEIARKRYDVTTTSYQFTGKLTYLLNPDHTVALAVYGNPTSSEGYQGGGLGNEGAQIFGLQSGSTDVSLRYLGKLFNKSMLVEATAAYHYQFGGGRFNKVTFQDIGNKTAEQWKNTPAIEWRQTNNLLSPFFNDGSIPDYQQSQAVVDACQIQANGFDPCPVRFYRTGGLGFIGNATLDRIGGVLKLTNFVDLAGHHQFKYGIDVARDMYDLEKFYPGGTYFRANGPNNAPTTYQAYRGFGQMDQNNPGNPLLRNDGSNRLAGDVVQTKTYNYSYAFFAQDSWSILDKLNLEIGVRGEMQKIKGDLGNLDPVAREHAEHGPEYPIDIFNLMPRVGLTYDFTGRGLSKVYASYGRFYEYIPLDLADRALSGEGQVAFVNDAQNCTDPGDPRTCARIPNAFGPGLTYVLVGAHLTEVDKDIKGQYNDEYQAGVQYQVWRDVAVGVDYVRKSVGRIIEDLSIDDGTTYFLTNPGVEGTLGEFATTATGTVVTFPKPRRVYDGLTLSVNKAFADNWLVTASYTYSQLRGNYPGLFRSETGQLDPNILSDFDLASLLPNRDGPLPGDVPSAFKMDAAYVYELDAKTTFQFGGNLRAQQGTPLSYLGAHPLYGAGEGFVLPRGAAGRLPWQWGINLRAQAAYKITKDYNLGVSVDLFNVTNNRQTAGVDQNYTFDAMSPIVNGTAADLAYLKNTAGAPAAVNPTFLRPTAYQLPFSARIGAKLSF